MEQFDALAYFYRMAEHNKLVMNNGFYVGYCSGPGGLQEVMQRTSS